MISLYIKKCKHCDLLYFGKTSKSGIDAVKYTGSGKYWNRHLKKHNLKVDTILVCEFETIEDARSYALMFSEINNIVESEHWANMIEENVQQGGFRHTEETKRKISKGNLGNHHTPEARKKMSLALLGNTRNIGRKHTEIARQHIKEAALRRGPMSEEHKQKIIKNLIRGDDPRCSQPGEKNPMYGKIYAFDLVENKYLVLEKSSYDENKGRYCSGFDKRVPEEQRRAIKRNKSFKGEKSFSYRKVVAYDLESNKIVRLDKEEFDNNRERYCGATSSKIPNTHPFK